jgi:hypothetical protein
LKPKQEKKESRLPELRKIEKGKEKEWVDLRFSLLYD